MRQLLVINYIELKAYCPMEIWYYKTVDIRGKWKMSKYKIVALIGESGCGKDTILNRVVSEYRHIFHKIITSTTRPPREREVGGFHYHFYNNNEDFIKKINSGDTIEHSVFNDWYYGTCKDDLNINKINIGVFNPTAVRALLKNEDCDVLVLYVRVSDKERLLR
jgi:guanylate kinase